MLTRNLAQLPIAADYTHYSDEYVHPVTDDYIIYIFRQTLEHNRLAATRYNDDKKQIRAMWARFNQAVVFGTNSAIIRASIAQVDSAEFSQELCAQRSKIKQM
jgi:hypothetical protein